MEDTTSQPTENVLETKEHNISRKKTRYFEVYISKLLKNNPEIDRGITSNAKQQLNSSICTICKILVSIVTQFTIISKKKTISEKEVMNAVKFLFNSEECYSYASNSVQKFVDSVPSSEGTKHSSRQDKAGILFPPSITEKYLRNFGFTKVMVTKNAPIYLAAVLEFITKKILYKSSVLAKENSRVRITIRDLELTVRTAPELSELWERCRMSFIGGGVLPQIHTVLLTKKPRKKRQAHEDTSEDIEVTKLGRKGHRFRPGTVSLREIKKFQKTSNCLTFARFPFERLVRSIISKYNSNMKVSKEVFVIIQYYIEQFVVDFLKDANSAAIHSGRVKLMAGDINFINNLRKYSVLDTSPFEGKEENVESETV